MRTTVKLTTRQYQSIVALAIHLGTSVTKAANFLALWGAAVGVQCEANNKVEDGISIRLFLPDNCKYLFGACTAASWYRNTISSWRWEVE